MKTLTNTIIAFAALSLLAAGVVPAGNASDEEIPASVEVQLQNAEVAAVLAQAQPREPAVPVLPGTPAPAPVPVPAAPVPTSVSSVNDNIYGLSTGFSFGSRTGGSNIVLVIPSGQTKTEDIITINEDMNVMSRIFKKNLEQARISSARTSMFVSRNDPFSMLLGGGRSGIQSMYLQDYGALFLLKVDFPLSPAPKAQEEEKETEKAEEGDPVWQQMRQEMYEPEKVDRRRRTDQPGKKYDPEKVENLKTSLIKALKHAANIRSLKPDESVILTVAGSGEATGTIITSSRFPGGNQVLITERNADGTMKTRIVQGNSLDDIGLSSPAILVIRTKKSDIDEFAKADIDFDQFRQRTQIFTCPYLGGVAESGDSFNPYMQLRSTGSRNRR